MPTVRRACCSATARFTATVDLPTPPLPEDTAIVCFTSGMKSGPAAGRAAAGRARARPAAGGAGAAPPILTCTFADARNLRTMREAMLCMAAFEDGDWLGKASVKLTCDSAMVQVADEPQRYDVPLPLGVLDRPQRVENSLLGDHMCDYTRTARYGSCTRCVQGYGKPCIPGLDLLQKQVIAPTNSVACSSHFASGVTVVTTCDADGRPTGLTASAFTSVSLEPPLILVCVDHKSQSYPALIASKTFAVNILCLEQEAVSRRFATTKIENKFDGVPFTLSALGLPLLDDALAQLECATVNVHLEGDHTIFVGPRRGRARGLGRSRCSTTAAGTTASPAGRAPLTLVPLSRPPVDDEIKQAVLAAIDSRQYILGPQCRAVRGPSWPLPACSTPC